MVEVNRGSRSRSSSSSASSGSSSSGSSSGSSSASSSSSSSSSSTSRSASSRRRTSRQRDDRRPARRSSRSPRRNSGARRSSKDRVPLPHRRSPSSAARRRSPERRRRSRSPVRRHESPRRAATPPPEPKRLAVRNLSRNLTKEHIAEIFGIYGALKSCEMPADRVHTHINRGYGYVEYEKAEDAEKALKHMHHGQIDGLEIECELTIPFRGSAAAGGSSTRRRSPAPLRGGRSPPIRGGRSPPRGGRSPPRRSGGGRRGSPVRGAITGANSIPLGRRSRSRSPRR